MFLIDASDPKDINFEQVERILDRFGENFKKNTLLLFTKNDKSSFDINKFIDLIKTKEFFTTLITIKEINVKDSNLRSKLLDIIIKMYK